jgi:hypothetical protein
MECFKLPLVPVMVITEVPGGVLLVVATVKVEVEGLGDVIVTGLGLNAQVLFEGHPLTVSVIRCAAKDVAPGCAHGLGLGTWSCG